MLERMTIELDAERVSEDRVRELMFSQDGWDRLRELLIKAAVERDGGDWKYATAEHRRWPVTIVKGSDPPVSNWERTVNVFMEQKDRLTRREHLRRSAKLRAILDDREAEERDWLREAQTQTDAFNDVARKRFLVAVGVAQALLGASVGDAAAPRLVLSQEHTERLATVLVDGRPTAMQVARRASVGLANAGVGWLLLGELAAALDLVCV